MKLKEDKVMFRLHIGNYPRVGSVFKFKPSIIQQIFGFRKFGKYMVLENNHFGNPHVRVLVKKGTDIEITAFGAMVSECIVLEKICA